MQRGSMSNILDRYREKVQRDNALLEDKCKRTAYAMARRYVKDQLQEKYELDEQEVDVMLENRVALIKKYANRLLPKVRQSQMNRQKSFTGGSKMDNLGQEERLEINESINRKFSEAFESSAVYAKGLDGNDTVKAVPVTEKRPVVLNKPNYKAEPQVVFSPPDRRVDHPKIQKAISKKADQTTIPDVVMKEVFIRGLNAWTEETGVSPEQYGFARMNSFINKGKSYYELDKDLANLDESLLLGLAAMGGVAAAGAAVGAAGAGLRYGINKIAGTTAAQVNKRFETRLANLRQQHGITPTPTAGGPNAAGAGTSPTALHGTNVNNAKPMNTVDPAHEKLDGELKKAAGQESAGQQLRQAAVGGIVNAVMASPRQDTGLASAGSQNVGGMPPSGMMRS
jgi:hypothetical protein